MPVVLSATRLRQSVHDAPISITVIDRELIEASGFTEIPDLMRLVPGFVVDYDSGHLPVTGYHMLHDRYVRHQQVLIDGRSVYTPILGGVPWVDLPITIDDIERIEVVRGPNAASYGSNSFLGVINIITRDAAVDRGTSVKINSGDNGLQEGFLRYGNKLGDLDYAISLAYRQDWGFEERYDDKEVDIATFRGDYQVDTNDSLIFEFGYNGGMRQEDNTIDLSVPDHKRTINSQYQQIRWIRALPNYGELRLQYYRTALEENKNNSLWNQDFFTERHDLELQHTFNAGGATRIVWGGSYRQDHSESDYFVRNEAPENVNIGRLFSNIEYRYSSKLILNAGLMVEDNELAGTDVLPRAGINYHITPRNTIRASVSRATRAPVLTEEYPNLDGLVPGGFYWQNDVAPEYITAYELGYLTENRDKSITADIKLYQEDISGLIQYSQDPSFSYYYFDNFDDATIAGLEAQFTIRPSPKSRIHVAYAHTNINSDNVTGLTKYDLSAPKNSLSLLGIWHFENDLDASLGYYYKSSHKQLAYATGDPIEYRPYKRVDVRLAKKFKGSGHEQKLALVIQNVFDETQESRLNNFPERRFYISYKLSLD
ncbi:MAG: TonB-dependent receptor [Thiohalophilus sp.]